MSKRANPMAVIAALSYEVGEAALVLGKTPATIRNWIKDGLPVMSSRKPYLISGEAIRACLRAKHNAARRPLGPDQLYCPACREAHQPMGMAATLASINARTSLLKGLCEHCGGTCTRLISTSKTSDFARTFNIKEGPDSEA